MMHKRHDKYTLVILLSMALLMGYIYLYQKTTETRLAAAAKQSLNYLPSGTFLKGMALGYDEAFADFFWVRTIGYFGAHAKTDQDYTWLTHMLRLTAELDPRYESPYEFAGVVLPAELNDVDGGMAFLEAGTRNIPKHNPRYWLQHFYLGLCYMIYKDNPVRAAQHLEIAAGYPQSPGYLPLLVARLYARADKPGVGLDILQSMLNADKSGLKQTLNFDDALRKRMHELIIVEHVRLLEHAVSEYTAAYQQRPSQLSDLVDGLILPFIPDEPLGGSYFLSIKGKKVFNTKFETEFRVYTGQDTSQVNISSQQTEKE